MPRGKRLRSQVKEVVMNVYHYFEKMDKKTKKGYATSYSALKRTSEATSKYIALEEKNLKTFIISYINIAIANFNLYR